MKRASEGIAAWVVTWGSATVFIINVPEDVSLLAAVVALMALALATARGNGRWGLQVFPLGIGVGALATAGLFATDFNSCDPIAPFKTESVALFGNQAATCGGIDPTPYFLVGSGLTMVGLAVLMVVVRRRRHDLAAGGPA